MTSATQTPNQQGLSATWWDHPDYKHPTLDIPGQSKLSAGGRKSLEAIASQVDAKKLSLPQISRAASSTLKLLREPNLEPEQIAASIGTDPTLTSGVLRLANSPLYGARVPIDTITRAVMHIGLRRIQALILEVTVKSVVGSIKNRAWSTMEWRSSVFSSIAARSLAQYAKQDGEAAQMAGLLHDIGRLPLLMAIENRGELNGDPEGGSDAEIILECLHRNVGKQLAVAWDLPPSVIDAIEHHMNGRLEDEPPAGQFATTILAELAGDIGFAAGFGRFKRPYAIQNERAWADVKIDKAAAVTFLCQEVPKIWALADDAART